MIPVILSGGSGTRLWPASRTQVPKQFVPFFGETLMDETIRRVNSLGSPRILTTQTLRTLTLSTAKKFDIPPENLLFEPSARNTAPAIALLCHLLAADDGDEVVGIFPADHWVEDNARFLQIARFAENLARQNYIVTLGIEPTSPSTAYGYIATRNQLDSLDDLRALHVQGFREKPNLETAQSFLKEGGYFWNAGMFIFKVSRMVEEFKRHQPKLWQNVSRILPDLSNAAEIYPSLEAISIDYAIMEKLTDLATIPSRIGWSDVGSWDELSRLIEKSKSSERVTQVDGSGASVYSTENGKRYFSVGVDDVVIADTADALVLVKKGESQKVKDLVQTLAAQKDPLVENHRNEIRPWGRFDILTDQPDFKAKVIVVNSQAQLSYQSHAKRAEHWVIVEGEGEVVLNDQIVPVRPGTHVHIPVGAKHRMRNSGSKPLKFVEIQLGSYFGEDDIVRYQDDYKRK